MLYRTEKVVKEVYYEVYLINQACAHMTDDERRRLLEIAKAVFPVAFEKTKIKEL